jgi:hypothetical protein
MFRLAGALDFPRENLKRIAAVFWALVWRHAVANATVVLGSGDEIVPRAPIRETHAMRGFLR